MGFEWGVLGKLWDGEARVAVQGVAVDEDVLIAGAAAFGGNDVRVVFEGDFVDDADEGFVPAVFVVFGCAGFGVVEGVGGVGGCSVADVGEAGFFVGYAREVEGHDDLWDEDVDLGERADAARAQEGLVAEVGAIGEVEDCFFCFWGCLEGVLDGCDVEGSCWLGGV